MRIYYCTDITLDDRSAETVHIDEICSNLARLQHTVVLYAPKPPHWVPKGYRGVLISAPRQLRSIFFQTRLFLRLLRDVYRNRPDVLYVRHNVLLCAPTLIGALFSIPVVLEVNGRLEQESKLIDHSFVGRALLRAGIFGVLESFNMHQAAALIAVTSGIKDYLLKKYSISAGKVHVIGNGVDLDLFKPLADADLRTKLNLDESSFYIGYIGSFYPWQGLRYLVEAARGVSEKRPKCKFLIVGSGEEGAYLSSYIEKEKLENAVEIRSAVSHTFVPPYIHALDICVSYPTAFRAGGTSPIKMYEYLACGKPVVLSDIAGQREEFASAAFYAAPESVPALERALITLIDDAQMRRELQSRGRAFVEQGHSWRIVAKRVADVCFDVIED